MPDKPTPNNDGVEPFVLDRWASLSFKRALGNRRVGGRSWMQPTWVGEHDRRLQAYNILTAIAENSARHYLADVSAAARGAHREYGDAGVIVETITAALLGEDQRIVTEGADVDIEHLEDEADVVNDDNGDDTERSAREAVEFQSWLEQWARDERLGLKVYETESSAVRLGDGVYALAWSDAKQRPVLWVFDPASYFPVLEDGVQNDYPRRVHVAWEIDDKDENQTKRRIHRLTWQLVEVEEAVQYAWNDGPSNVTCLYSDGIWTIDATGKQTVDDFTEATVEWQTLDTDDGPIEAHNVDLAIDFIPVVHMPNTPSIQAHYGRSSLSLVAQILDDLANADTDLQAASATTGNPAIALAGVRLPSDDRGNPVAPVFRPGAVWPLGENGSAHMIDTSSSLDALLKYVDALLERLSVNSRIPGSVLGRVQPGDVASGIALLLSFGPMRSIVQQMRLVRDEKYPLLFKFAHRLALAGGAENVPPRWVPTTLEFGRFLPEDVAAIVTQVKDLLAAKAISLETAVRMLMDAGLPIDDVIDEVQRIRENDFDGAESLLAATGDKQLVADYLGVELSTPPAPQAPPTPTVPLLPPNPTAPPQE